MTIEDRSLMYEYVNTDIEGNVVDGDSKNAIHKIPDFINTKLIDMELPVVDNFRIGDIYEHRPDLISQKYYGNFHFGWLLAYHNKMLDMTTDFYSGRLIEIPDLNAYFKYFNRFSRDD